MSDVLQALSYTLEQAINPDPARRRQAEEALKQNSNQPGFNVLLLQLVQNTAAPYAARLTAALFFKNEVERRWSPAEDSPYTPIPEQDRITIKQNLINLMLSQDVKIGKILSAALQTISKYDFPQAWPNLLPEMVSKLNTNDFNVINGVMRTLNYVFKSYRYKIISDPVLLELKHVLEVFADPLTKIYVSCCEQIPSNFANPQVLTMLFKLIKTMLAIFYSLNYLDLPEYFEDNMNVWFSNMHNLLVYETKLTDLLEHPSSEDAPGILGQTQASVFRNLNLYISKYEDEFKPFVQQFITDTWNLLVKTGLEPRNDLLVTSAIQFLSTTAKGIYHEVFAAPGVLEQICKTVIIPNIRLRESDEMTFMEEPIEYLQRDIEGSDVGTRRRAATDLVTSLRKFYSEPITKILAGHITELLANYASNPQANWRSKDQVIYLVIALAALTKTDKAGATSVNSLVPVDAFFEQHVLPELQSATENLPVIKADALKYALMFRTQLGQRFGAALMPIFVRLLESSSGVVVSYASLCIDRYRTPEFYTPVLEAALGNFFKVLGTDEHSENPYVMRALLRLVSTCGPAILPFAHQVLMGVCNKLAQIYKNPKNPHFTHYLFEAMASIIQTLIKAGNYTEVEKAEAVLMPAFQTIINEDIIDLAPYVFQIMAQLIEARRQDPQGLVQRFGELLRKFVHPMWWERHGNVPALARLVRAYITFAPEFVAQNHLMAVLGVFQKLISVKSLDSHGFLIMRDIITHMDPKYWEQYVPEIYRILFARLQTSKTITFVTHLITFTNLFIARHGPEVVIDKINSVQAGIFLMLLQTIWVPNANRVSDSLDVKYCVLGHTKLLFNSQWMLSAPQVSQWMPLLSATIQLLAGETNETASPEFEEETLGLEELGGTTNVFSRLMHSTENWGVPFQELNEAKTFLSALQTFNRQHPGFLQQAGQLEPSVRETLQKLFAQHGFTEPYL